MIVIIVFQTEHKKYGPRYEVLGYCISSSSDGGGDPTSTVSAYFCTIYIFSYSQQLFDFYWPLIWKGLF